MGLYVGNTKYKVMSGSDKSSLISPFPYDSEVEYLQFTGTQSIDTGIVLSETDIVEIDAKFNSGVTKNYNQLISSIGSSSSYVFLRLTKAGTTYYARYGATTSSTVTADTPFDRHVFKLKKSELYEDGVKILTLSYNSMPSANAIIGAVASNTCLIGNVYELIIYDSLGEERIHLVPVRKGTAGYLYDKVSNQLFGNSGTGNFVLGPDITTIYDSEVEYLESTGTQYIDTKIVHNGTYKWECDCAILEMNYSDYFLMGQTYSSGNYRPRFAFGINNYNKWYAGIANKNVNSSILADKNRHVFTLDAINKKLTVDETEIEVNWSSFLFPTTLCGLTLFGRAILDTGTISPYIKARIYSSKHYDNGTLVLNLIPVRVGQVGYMYDTISHKLFGNSGTGSFIVGNDKN